MYFNKLIYINLFYRVYQILFSLFIPLITFQKGSIHCVWAILLLVPASFFCFRKGIRVAVHAIFFRFQKVYGVIFYLKKDENRR